MFKARITVVQEAEAVQYEVVQPFGSHKPGDVVEVPDGAAVAEGYYRPLIPAAAPETPPEAVTAPPAPVTEEATPGVSAPASPHS